MTALWPEADDPPEVMLMADLRSSRSGLTLVEGAPLERLREFLIAADSVADAPGALRDADRLWRSATLRCGMRRRPLSGPAQIALGGLTDDMVHCWWLDQAFEVRDVGSGRIVSFPLPDDVGEPCDEYIRGRAEAVLLRVPPREPGSGVRHAAVSSFRMTSWIF